MVGALLIAVVLFAPRGLFGTRPHSCRIVEGHVHERGVFQVEHLQQNFGGLAVTRDISLALRAGRSRRADRPERRRQDHLRQSGDRTSCARTPARSCSAARMSRVSTRPGASGRVWCASSRLRACFRHDAGRAHDARHSAANGTVGPHVRRLPGHARCDGRSRRAPSTPRRSMRSRPARSARSPMASSAFWKSRSRWRCSRRCCCSTSLRPVFRRATRRASRRRSHGLPPISRY